MSLVVEIPHDVTLYAGGTTGLVFLDGAGTRTAFWAAVAERAEEEGLSALTFGSPVDADQSAAALRAARQLRTLGVERIVVVAAGADASAALEAAAGDDFAAVVLLDPAIRDEVREPLLAETPLPKLVLVTDGDDTQAAAIYRHAVGPTVIRQLPQGDGSDLAVEAMLGFTVGVCGDGRPA
jgi:hypothetical protein